MKHKATWAPGGFGVAGLLLAVVVLSTTRFGTVELFGVFMMLPAVILAWLVVSSNNEPSSL